MGVVQLGVVQMGVDPPGGQFSNSFYLLHNNSKFQIPKLFRSPLSIVIWASHFCFWRNVPQIEAGNFWAILYLSTVEQQQSPLGLVDRYVDLANPCFAILGEQNLELCSWCCVASISPAALWHHPQRSCEGENKNISLERGHPVKQ